MAADASHVLDVLTLLQSQMHKENAACKRSSKGGNEKRYDKCGVTAAYVWDHLLSAGGQPRRALSMDHYTEVLSKRGDQSDKTFAGLAGAPDQGEVDIVSVTLSHGQRSDLSSDHQSVFVFTHSGVALSLQTFVGIVSPSIVMSRRRAVMSACKTLIEHNWTTWTPQYTEAYDTLSNLKSFFPKGATAFYEARETTLVPYTSIMAVRKVRIADIMTSISAANVRNVNYRLRHFPAFSGNVTPQAQGSQSRLVHTGARAPTRKSSATSRRTSGV